MTFGKRRRYTYRHWEPPRGPQDDRTEPRPRWMRHGDWMKLHEEYGRLDAARDAGRDEWQRPTDCTAWDVRQMVAHLVGAAESNARVLPSSSGRPGWAGRSAAGRPLVDGINDVQVRERADRANRPG